MIKEILAQLLSCPKICVHASLRNRLVHKELKILQIQEIITISMFYVTESVLQTTKDKDWLPLYQQHPERQ